MVILYLEMDVIHFARSKDVGMQKPTQVKIVMMAIPIVLMVAAWSAIKKNAALNGVFLRWMMGRPGSSQELAMLKEELFCVRGLPTQIKNMKYILTAKAKRLGDGEIY